MKKHLQDDYVHMQVSIPPKYSASQVVGLIKGESPIHTSRSYSGRHKKYNGIHFRAREYFISSVGADEAATRTQIRNKEKADARLEHRYSSQKE